MSSETEAPLVEATTEYKAIPEETRGRGEKRGGGEESDSDPEGRALEQSLTISAVDGDEDHHFELPPEGSMRRKIIQVLTSHKVEALFLILLVFDILFVMAELEIATHIVCKMEWEEGISGEEAIINSSIFKEPVNCSRAAEEAPLTGYSCHNRRVFTLPLEFSPCPFKVTEELPPALETAESVVGWCSRVIIYVFGVELITLLLCGGPKLFWHHKLYLFDAIVIFVAIVLDSVELSQHNADITAIADVIVCARVWRFSRLIHASAAGSTEMQKKKEEAKKAKEAEEKEQQMSARASS